MLKALMIVLLCNLISNDVLASGAMPTTAAAAGGQELTSPAATTAVVVPSKTPPAKEAPKLTTKKYEGGELETFEFPMPTARSRAQNPRIGEREELAQESEKIKAEEFQRRKAEEFQKNLAKQPGVLVGPQGITTKALFNLTDPWMAVLLQHINWYHQIPMAKDEHIYNAFMSNDSKTILVTTEMHSYPRNTRAHIYKFIDRQWVDITAGIEQPFELLLGSTGNNRPGSATTKTVIAWNGYGYTFGEADKKWVKNEGQLFVPSYGSIKMNTISMSENGQRVAILERTGLNIFQNTPHGWEFKYRIPLTAGGYNSIVTMSFDGSCIAVFLRTGYKIITCFDTTWDIYDWQPEISPLDVTSNYLLTYNSLTSDYSIYAKSLYNNWDLIQQVPSENKAFKKRVAFNDDGSLIITAAKVNNNKRDSRWSIGFMEKKKDVTQWKTPKQDISISVNLDRFDFESYIQRIKVSHAGDFIFYSYYSSDLPSSTSLYVFQPSLIYNYHFTASQIDMLKSFYELSADAISQHKRRPYIILTDEQVDLFATFDPAIQNALVKLYNLTTKERKGPQFLLEKAKAIRKRQEEAAEKTKKKAVQPARAPAASAGARGRELTRPAATTAVVPE